jgi:hypothetical protein
MIQLFRRSTGGVVRIDTFAAFSCDWEDTKPKFYWAYTGSSDVQEVRAEIKVGPEEAEQVCRYIESVTHMTWMGSVHVIK